MNEQLLDAIAEKDLSRVEELLATGADPNTRRGDKTAYQLVPHGANEIKCALIEAGAEDPELKHALVWVIYHTERIKAVQTLIEKGADLNVSTGGGTPIQVAASRGYTAIAELLIAAGADVDSGSGISTPLLEALEHGYTDIALLLIAAGADPNLTSSYGRVQPLAMAAAQGDPVVIRALIEAGADVNGRVSHITLNRLAIRQQAASGLQTTFKAMEFLGGLMEESNDDLPALESQLAEMESAAAQQRTRQTEPENAVDTFPVIIAARCGHAEALATLLEFGADPHCKDGEYLSAYDWAQTKEYPDVLRVLRQFGVDGTLFSVDELLLLAAEKGEVEKVQDCLNQGAQINARDDRSQTRNKTPLMLAAYSGHLPVVQMLLNAGADPNITDLVNGAKTVSKSLLEHTDKETILKMGYRLGRTALMDAATVGHTDIVQSLLAAGANPNHKDILDVTTLALAIENNHLTTVIALVSAGADVNEASTYGDTPIIIACEKGNFDIGQFLIAQGADATLTNSNNETSLMKACASNSLPLVRLCIQQGVDVNILSHYLRRTALGMAAEASHYVRVDSPDRSTQSGMREYRDDGSCWEWQSYPEDRIIDIVRLLLEAGADPNIPDCQNTPLSEAARNDHLSLLQVLLSGGARLEVRTQDGDTAVSLAKLYKRQRILSFLQQYTGTDLSEFEKVENQDEEDEEDKENEEDEEFLLPQPDFTVAAQNPDYQAAVEEIASLCGSPPISYNDIPGWFSIHINSKRRRDIKTEELQKRFLERGCFVYEPHSCFGNDPERLSVAPTTDKYEVIALHQTNGCNYDISPVYVVKWLKELEQTQPFILTCIKHDTLSGRFLTPIQDPEGLAQRMYDFCPDIVDQGCGSLAELTNILRSSDDLYFWWD